MSRYHCALVASCIGIAAAPILVSVSEVDPPTTLWLRMLLASAVLSIADRWRRRTSDEPLSVVTVWWLGAASVIFALDLLAFHLAVVRTSVANTALLGNISPIIVAPLAYLFIGERQTLRGVSGLVVAFAGVALLVNTGHTPDGAGSSVIGDALAAFSGSLYALYMLIGRKLRMRVTAAWIMFWNCVVTVVILTPVVAYNGEINFPHSLTGWLVIAAMALGCQILGHGLLVYAMFEVPASFASVALLSAPVVAAVMAWVFFGEVPTLTQSAGGALVLIGLGVAALSEARRTAGTKSPKVSRSP